MLLSLIFIIIQALIVFAIVGAAVAVTLYSEIKVASHVQSKLGYMRTGWHGSLQGIADMIKLLLKEEILPGKIDKLIFLIAPYVAFLPVFLSFIAIPLGPGLIVKDLNIGILYFLAISSVGAIGIIMAGWSSYNKYSLIGGLRSTAQVISYEIPHLLSILPVIMLTGSLSTVSIVNAQEKVWYIFLQPLGFLIYFISTLAECNRTPFDLPEAESELVSGYHTEYSGMRFGLFFMAEYTHVIAGCAMATILFLGGWRGVFLPPFFWFLLKTSFLVFIVLLLRWTLPRFRMDQHMYLNWYILLPLSLFNLIITGLGILLF
jgi:NADH-quinone oxidoreductase subunit H